MKEIKLEREKSKVIGKHFRTRNSIVTGVFNPVSVGATFYILESGEVASKFTLNENHEGHAGVAHGGIVSSILDEAMGISNSTAANPYDFLDHTIVTGEYTVRCVNPVPIGEELLCFAKREQKEGRKNFCKSVIVNKDNIILAKAHGIFIDVPYMDSDEHLEELEINKVGLTELDPKEI